jgi:hypothetical protein
MSTPTKNNKLSKKAAQQAIAAAKKTLQALREERNIKGVSISSDSPMNPYRAKITVDREVYSLGYFNDPLVAAQAYNKQAKTIFGGVKPAKDAGMWNNI